MIYDSESRKAGKQIIYCPKEILEGTKKAKINFKKD